MRSVKNVTKGYSSVQVKVREGMLSIEMACDVAAFARMHLALTSHRSHE
jgi:hypothetical protein